MTAYDRFIAACRASKDGWNGRYLCYYCSREGVRTHAAIRAFAGVTHSGEGFPACEEHARKATEAALRTLVSKGIDPEKWTVVVYAVEETERGYPAMTRELFTARPKPTALQGAAHATRDPQARP